MAWQLLAAALPAAAKVAGTALQKPREQDYKPQTDYMKKYLGYLRGRSASKDVMHMAMQPQLRSIGRQGRQMQRQVGYDVERSGLTGSGIEAQMRLSAGQKTQEALTTATERAVAAQGAETARLGEKAADLGARIEAEEKRAEQAYDTAQSQWKRQLAGDVIGLGASVASAGITQAGQLKEAKLSAIKTGMFGDAANVQRMIDEGWTPQMFQAETQRMTQLYQTVLGNENITDVTAALQQYSGIPVEGRIVTEPDDPDTDPMQYIGGLDPNQPSPPSPPPTALKEISTDVQPEIPEVKPTVKPTVKPAVKPTIKADQSKIVRDIRPVSREIKGQDPSTVLMEQSDNFAYPTLFPKDPDNPSSDPADWIELEGDAAFEEAKRRGEVFEFESEKEATEFAKGNWKTSKPAIKPVERPEYSPPSAEPEIEGDVELEKLEFGDVSGLKKPAAKPEIGKSYIGTDSKGNEREIKVLSVDKDGNIRWSYRDKDGKFKIGKTPLSREKWFKAGMQSKKKSEKDVVGIREKLVQGKHNIVNVTKQIGQHSVLAEGKANIRMAKPLANKFMEAQKILADKGIEIQVGDSLVNYGVKKKQYEEYIAEGSTGDVVAHPDRSFHTIGFAFDLAQTNEMKNPEIAEVFKSVGLVPHPTEWWHWSLEEI